MKAVKERPIIFKPDMVRAILDGRKTQTRRLMNHQPLTIDHKFMTVLETTSRDSRKIEGKHHWALFDGAVVTQSSPYFSSKFGYPDDELWVKENFTPDGKNFYPFNKYTYEADNEITKYEIENGRYCETINGKTQCYPFKWRPSIHMPRVASRINLKIKNVRVEKLQDITEADAIAEGMIKNEFGWSWKKDATKDESLGSARSAFANLINFISGGKNWNFYYSEIPGYEKPIFDQNPWVWVYDFEVIK